MMTDDRNNQPNPIKIKPVEQTCNVKNEVIDWLKIDEKECS